MGAAARMLIEALRYPQKDFDAGNQHQFRSLVRWLENTQIRQWDIKERGIICALDHPEWNHALSKYLKDLDYGSAWTSSSSSSSSAEVAEWLLAYAVGLKYEDTIDKGTGNDGGAKPSGPKGGSAEEAAAVVFRDVDAAFLQGPEVFGCCAALGIEPSGNGLEDLEAVRRLLEDPIVPLLRQRQQEQQATGGGLAVQDVRMDSETQSPDLPLGFSTGDAAVDKAAAALRMLHVKDLRRLQTQIDKAIIAMQALTADPKVDAALGKVGR